LRFDLWVSSGLENRCLRNKCLDHCNFRNRGWNARGCPERAFAKRRKAARIDVRDEAEQGAKAALGGRSAAAAETEKDHGIRQPERTLGRKSLEIEILKKFLGSRRLDMILDYLSDPDEFRDFEMQRIERLPVGVVRPRKV